jgi:GntR family transcriptional repressor for pyruvate dehydrogenase complex
MAQGAAVAAVFEPVQPPTTFEETVERLGTAIRLGILGPGTRLPSERELAEQLGISRSTLRQAITTLVQSGHLESVRGRGGGTFVVQQPPLAEGAPGDALPEDFAQTLGLRLAVEAGVVVLAAERATAEDVQRLREAIVLMDGATEFEAYRRGDVRFHIGLAEATRVPRLVALLTEVQGEVSELIAHIAHPAEVLTHANAEHARIADALEARDVAAAVELLRRHLEGTQHILEGLRPGMTGPPADGGSSRRRAAPYSRTRSPSGSKSGSAATWPGIHAPKMSTSTAVPTPTSAGSSA